MSTAPVIWIPISTRFRRAETTVIRNAAHQLSPRTISTSALSPTNAQTTNTTSKIVRLTEVSRRNILSCRLRLISSISLTHALILSKACLLENAFLPRPIHPSGSFWPSISCQSVQLRCRLPQVIIFDILLHLLQTGNKTAFQVLVGKQCLQQRQRAVRLIGV